MALDEAHHERRIGKHRAFLDEGVVGQDEALRAAASPVFGREVAEPPAHMIKIESADSQPPLPQAQAVFAWK